ncbi:type VI secretion system baseplate subunit TssF, partial [Pseudomonas aeruginosa]
GLNRALRRCHGEELELVVLFGKHDQRLEGTVDAEQLVPFCTPAINLFPRRCDRIHLSDRVNEHHVIVDRTRPLDFEVHSLQQVSGHGSGPEQPFQPFYAVRDPARYGREQAYFSVRREPRGQPEQAAANAEVGLLAAVARRVAHGVERLEGLRRTAAVARHQWQGVHLEVRRRGWGDDQVGR